MEEKIPMRKGVHFFLTKMLAGVAVVVAMVVLVEWLRAVLLDRTTLCDDTKAFMVAVIEAFLATSVYILLFKTYDKRKIDELSRATLLPHSIAGFFTGILLQCLFIGLIYCFGTFVVVKVNPVSSLLSPLAFGLSAGFVAGIILVGVVFRLLEEQVGTVLALLAFIVLFALLHANSKGATLVSVGATAMQAGFMLPAAYVFSRSLWLPVFLHVSWDFAEPGIFGAINPSTSLKEGWLTSEIAGHSWLTGGETGPQDSLTSLLLCWLLGTIFLLLAKRKNNWLEPQWRTTAPNANQSDQRSPKS